MKRWASVSNTFFNGDIICVMTLSTYLYGDILSFYGGISYFYGDFF